jgi:hypothetical protein
VMIYKEAQKKSKNYNMAPHFYSKHPDKDCEHAIRSRSPAGGLQRPGGTAPIPAGDKTTWLGGGLRCHCNPAEDPHAEEEQARDLDIVIERGVANPMTMVCGGRQRPTQRNRRMKPNLRRLRDSSTNSGRSSTVSSHPPPPWPAG